MRPNLEPNKWPVQLQSGAAGVFNLLTAPSPSMSYFLDGVIGSTASQTFKILRPSHADLLATKLWTIADHADVDIAANEDFLFAFWIKLASGGKSKTIFSKDNSSADRYRFTTSAAGLPVFFCDDAGTDDCTVTGTTNICDGQWHWIGIGGDRDVVQGLTMYVDGAAEATNAVADDFTDVGAFGTAADVVWTSPTGGMSLSTFGLYTGTAFTAAAQAIEVARLYNGGYGLLFEGTETNLTFACNMTDGEGVDTLAIKGTTTATFDAVTWTAGGVPFINADAMETLIDIVSNVQGAFAHPIKIGAGAALQIETSADIDLLFFGHTDSR